jgi:ribose 5-phosphate isomerase B
MMTLSVGLGCDHVGFGMKRRVAEYLEARGTAIVDLGCASAEPVDYPHYAAAVARAVAQGEVQRGVVLCGTGVGVSIAANRVRGARAANASDETLVRLARGHNDINILCLGAEMIGFWKARACLEAFLDTPFEGCRHVPRVAQLDSPSAAAGESTKIVNP